MSGRVLFVAPSAYTLGGLATWLDYLLPGLERHGWTATLGLVEGPRHHRPDAYLAKHPYDRTVAIEARTGTERERVSQAAKAIARVRPDLVLSVNIPDAVVGAAVRQRAGQTVRGVVTCHGIQPDLYDDQRALRGVADSVICTNRLACRLATVDAGWPAERVRHAWYGVATEGVAAVGRDPGEPFTLAYVGRIEEEQKRTRDLVPIWTNVCRGLAADDQAGRLLIAGGGPDEPALRAAFDAAERAGDVTPGSVRWLGIVPPERLHSDVWSQADAMLMPSCWETGPITIPEALAASVPVVSSRYIGSGLEGNLVDGKNVLLYDIGDVDAAADAVLRLRDDALRQRLVDGGHKLVRERLSQSVSIARWDAVLRNAMADPIEPKTLPKPAVSGRLDRLLPAAVSVPLRRAIRRVRPLRAGDPSGEWPHRRVASDRSLEDFWTMAAELDRPGAVSLVAGDSFAAEGAA